MKVGGCSIAGLSGFEVSDGPLCVKGVPGTDSGSCHRPAEVVIGPGRCMTAESGTDRAASFGVISPPCVAIGSVGDSCGLSPVSDISKPPAVDLEGPGGIGTAAAGSINMNTFRPPIGSEGLPVSIVGSTGAPCGRKDGLGSGSGNSKLPAMDMVGTAVTGTV